MSGASVYAELDAEIVQRIKVSRSIAFSDLLSRLDVKLANISRELPTDRHGNRPEDYRILDRRLQALRKAGTIKFVREGARGLWYLNMDAQA